METAPAESRTETATLGGGCFWCTEAVFQRIPGVTRVVSGYMGGPIRNPTYEQVSTGRTGHAEVIQIGFDPAKISFDRLLEVFWAAHDPTQLNRQGADVGTQYRSVIFVHSDAQKRAAEASKRALAEAGTHGRRPIVTEIAAASEFWPAEDYNQNYFNRNPNQGYCRIVIAPKLEKLGLE